MMHFFAALVALVTALLYADRSGWLYVHGTQSRSAILTRACMCLLMLAIGVGYLDLALEPGSAPFEWRHWTVLVALVGVAVGHLGLRRGPRDPT